VPTTTCITGQDSDIGPAYAVTATFTFTAPGGTFTATGTGTGTSTWEGAHSVQSTFALGSLTIANGTRRFARASGALTIAYNSFVNFAHAAPDGGDQDAWGSFTGSITPATN
jgi:hypothetical protein